MGLHPPATPGSPRQWWQRRVKLRWGRRHFAPGRSKKKTTVLFYDMMGPCWQQWYKHKTINHTYPCLLFMIYRILENWKKWDRHDSLHTKVCSPNRLLMIASHKAIFYLVVTDPARSLQRLRGSQPSNTAVIIQWCWSCLAMWWYAGHKEIPFPYWCLVGNGRMIHNNY